MCWAQTMLLADAPQLQQHLGYKPGLRGLLTRSKVSNVAAGSGMRAKSCALASQLRPAYS